MSRGVRDADVLVDSYNLALEHGSGIKTYTLSLLDALHTLGARSWVLTDRTIAKSPHSVVEEALLFDPNHRVRSRSRPSAALMAAAALLSGGRAKRYAPQHVQYQQSMFHVDELAPLAGLVNARNIFQRALGAFYAIGYAPTLRLDVAPKLVHWTTPLPIRVADAPLVTTIHDLVPLRLPYATLDDKRFFDRLVRFAIRVSKLILTVSEHSKRDLMEIYQVPDERIVVTGQSLPPPPKRLDEGAELAVLRRFDVAPQDYVLFAGNVEPKKNVKTLISAMASAEIDKDLVIVGRKAWLHEQQLKDAKALGNRIKMIDYVDRESLESLYRNAFCLAFPSLYEGFGLPPLEAMRAGCPVLASDASSLPEVCGDAASYFAPTNAAALRHALQQLNSEAGLRDRMIARGKQRALAFSPQQYARKLQSAYELALS